MSWSGGTYRKGNYLTNGWTGDAAAGIGIEAGRHDTQDDDFANGINACLAKDGSNAATGNINLNANKIINVSSATTRTDAPNAGQIQDSAFVYGGTSGGAANVQTLTLTPAITAYAAGQEFSFIAGFSNSGTTTLNVNGVGAKNVFNSVTNAALVGGEIVAGRAYKVIYDGTQFQLFNAANINSSAWAGTTGGTSTAYTLTPSPAIAAYTTGQVFRFIANASNGANPTLAVSGLVAKNIVDNTSGSAIGANRFVANKTYAVVYDGTQFRLLDDAGDVQNGGSVYGATSGGAANAQTLTLSPAITAYAAGQRFSFLAGFTNTAAATLNVNGVGAKNIFNAATGAAIGAGEVVSGRAYDVLYDGTQFQLLNDITPVQNQDYIWLGTTGGAASVQTASATPAITAYKAGQLFRFISGFNNGGATTLNINGLGAKNIYDIKTNAALKGSQMIAGYAYMVLYDGTQFLLLNAYTGWVSWTPTITQGVAVTKTVNYAKYRIDGTTCQVSVGCTITSAGTAGQGIQFTLPITAASSSYRAAGSAAYYRAGITQYYTLTALFDATSASYVIFANDASTNLYFGQAPSFGMANNDGLILNLTYEIA